MNIILSTMAVMGKALASILACAEAEIPEHPQVLIELAVGDPVDEKGEIQPISLLVHMEFEGPVAFAQCVLNSV